MELRSWRRSFQLHGEAALIVGLMASVSPSQPSHPSFSQGGGQQRERRTLACRACAVVACPAGGDAAHSQIPCCKGNLITSAPRPRSVHNRSRPLLFPTARRRTCDGHTVPLCATDRRASPRTTSGARRGVSARAVSFSSICLDVCFLGSCLPSQAHTHALQGRPGFSGGGAEQTLSVYLICRRGLVTLAGARSALNWRWV